MSAWRRRFFPLAGFLVLVMGAISLPERWHPLRHHDGQHALWTTQVRFPVAAAGRRSGKTELAKRRGVLKALNCTLPGGRFGFAAPVWQQAKGIYWKDLKRLVPRRFMLGRPSESELSIRLVNGAELFVTGMDRPERVEGQPLDWICLDEYGNMRADVWGEHVRPALSTPGRPPGEAWFIGVPEGRNHFYELFNQARADSTGQWAAFHWKSAEILDPLEIEAAKRDLDPLTYEQEYEASFISFSGRAYYPFRAEVHAARRLRYDPGEDLVFCFDFNREPGVAVVCQELVGPCANVLGGPTLLGQQTHAIGEVYIPRNSNTIRVCEKLAMDWRLHRNNVYCYGDASGGAGGSAKIMGSDWDLVRKILYPVFGERLKFRVPAANGPERVRVNSLNARLQSADGVVRLLVDPVKAPNLVRDFEGVTVIEGGVGEIDKKGDENRLLTHLTDAIGYYVVEDFPLRHQGFYAKAIA